MEPKTEDEGILYTLASECEGLFVDVQEAVKKAVLANAVEELCVEFQYRFTTWTTNLGVFAYKNQRLDTRLQHFPDLQDLTIRLLDLLRRCLCQWKSASYHPWDDKVEHLQITLQGIDDTLSRLHNLGVTIRQSSADKIDLGLRKIPTEYPFEHLYTQAIHILYPRASLTLKNWLVQSMEIIIASRPELIQEKGLTCSTWRKHTDQDLKLYVCLLGGCSEANHAYPDFDQWNEHMQQHDRQWHRKLYLTPSWVCTACESGHHVYDTPQALYDHLQQYHTDDFTEKQLQVISRQSKIERQRAWNVCLLCSFKVENENGDRELTEAYQRRKGPPVNEAGVKTSLTVESTSTYTHGRRSLDMTMDSESDSTSESDTDESDYIKERAMAMGRHVANHLQTLVLLMLRFATLTTATENIDDHNINSDLAEIDDEDQMMDGCSESGSVPDLDAKKHGWEFTDVTTGRKENIQIDDTTVADFDFDNFENTIILTRYDSLEANDDVFLQGVIGSGAYQSWQTHNSLPGSPDSSLVWTASNAASIRTWDTEVDMSDAEFTLPNQEALIPSPRLHVETLKKYQCPICFLDDNIVEFGRRSDLMKHLNNFHGSNVVWICQTKSCHLSFATERSYCTHAKKAHKIETPSHRTARSDLCPQLVFSCGFSTCKERIFEASNRDEAAECRIEYFVHIMKHFEDNFDINEWEYRIQIYNLMRQSRLKSIWKTRVPKENRRALSWKPRSSGDLKRMLECRHLGEDISQLVRLACILGRSPFTHSRTPPPSEIDLHFPLPFRSQCLVERDDPAESEEGGIVSLITKSRLKSVFNPGGRRQHTHKSRPSTPPPVTISDMHMSSSDHAAGHGPGTPIPIPQEGTALTYASTSRPDHQEVPLPKQADMPVNINGLFDGLHTMHNSPDIYTFSDSVYENQGHPLEYHKYHEQTPVPDGGVLMSLYKDSISYHDYGHDQDSTVRPVTPVPHKGTTGWSQFNSMEDIHPQNCSQVPSQGSPYIHDSPIAIEPGEVMPMPMSMNQMIPQYYHQHQHQHHQVPPPTSIPSQEWALPVRMGKQPQRGYQPHHPQQQQQQDDSDMSAPMTFFFDDEDGRM